MADAKVDKKQEPRWLLSEAYKEVMRTEAGQIVFNDLVKKFAYTEKSTLSADPLRMAHNEGTRTVMVYIGQMLAMDEADAAATTASHGVE